MVRLKEELFPLLLKDRHTVGFKKIIIAFKLFGQFVCAIHHCKGNNVLVLLV